MLAGQRAFRRETMAETMTAILKEEPPELSDTNAKINPQLEKIVRRCLEKNRANFDIPVSQLEAPGFGKATDTVTPARRIQIALKYSF